MQVVTGDVFDDLAAGFDDTAISEDGAERLEERASAPRADAESLGRRIAEGLLARGAASMVALAPRAPAA